VTIYYNPIYETINSDRVENLDATLYCSKMTVSLKDIEEWEKNNSLDPEPIYYKAIFKLESQEFEEFKILAQRYLFKNRNTNIAAVMIRYYLAIVEWFEYRNFNEAMKNLAFCLASNPLMAEFWCLLGDIFVNSHDFEKAICFYENATILGNRRLKTDFWPMQISKYEAYPNEMIKKCRDLLKNKQGFFTHNPTHLQQL